MIMKGIRNLIINIFNPNLILSDKGFSVEILSKKNIKYKEGEKVITIMAEIVVNPNSLAIYKNSIKNWDAPFHEDLINQAKRDEIIENIKNALEYKKIKVEVD